MAKRRKNPKINPIIPPKEHVYLDGPKSRGYELNFAWRVLKQFIMGFRCLHFVGPCITVFGSARFKEDNPGRWLWHCHVFSHQDAGMAGWYLVE